MATAESMPGIAIEDAPLPGLNGVKPPVLLKGAPVPTGLAGPPGCGLSGPTGYTLGIGYIVGAMATPEEDPTATTVYATPVAAGADSTTAERGTKVAALAPVVVIDGVVMPVGW